MSDVSSAPPVVAHFIGSLQVGGAENQVVMQLDQLVQGGFTTHVITLNECENGFREMLPATTAYYCINYRRPSALSALVRLFRYLKLHNIDILHCHMYHAAVKGAVVGKLAGVPVIITSEHGKNTWKTGWHHAVERYLVNPVVDQRVAVSEDIRAIRMREDKVDPGNICVISNAVNTDCETSDVSSTPEIFGAVGRLVDAKDYPVMFEAVRTVRSRGYNIQLRVAGDGELRSVLADRIRGMGMENSIHLDGLQNTQKFLSHIDVFLMSSKREGVPVSLLEAMAYGLPIVATGVGGIPEVVSHRSDALLCPPGDPLALADNMVAVIEDDASRVMFAENARKTAVDKYGIGAIGQQWAQLYRGILDKKRNQ